MSALPPKAAQIADLPGGLIGVASGLIAMILYEILYTQLTETSAYDTL